VFGLQHGKQCIGSSHLDRSQHIERQAPASLGKGEVILGPVRALQYARRVEDCKEKSQKPLVLPQRFNVARVQRGA